MSYASSTNKKYDVFVIELSMKEDNNLNQTVQVFQVLLV